MNPRGPWIAEVTRQLGITIDAPFTAALPDGSSVEAIARLRGLGGPQGMLIFHSADVVYPFERALVNAGYGYSVLSEPEPNDAFDIEVAKQMFLDWSWCGPEDEVPAWMAKEAADVLKRLQAWFLAQCDGDWEHTSSLSIVTLDNPGWAVDIDLRETELYELEFPPVRVQRPDENDWVDCRVEGGMFLGRCGPKNLDETLRIFLDWAGG